MAFLPPAAVTAPTIPPARFGLFSVANVVPTNDPHIAGGVHYESSLLCADGAVLIADDDCTSEAFGEDVTNPLYIDGVPAIVTSGYECTGPMDLAAFESKAVKAVDANLERLLSAALFTGIFDPTDATAVTFAGQDPNNGLAALEGAARLYYSGQPVIHASAALISSITEGYQIERVGNHLETQSGALVNPLASAAVNVIFMTGYLTIWRGPNRVYGPVQEKNGSGNFTNLWRTVAATPVAVANDCGIFFKATVNP